MKILRTDSVNSCKKAAEKLLIMSLYQHFKMRPILMQIVAKKCFLTCVLYIIFNESKVFCCAPTFNSCSFPNTTISLQKLRGTHRPDRECFSFKRFKRAFGLSPFCLDCRDNQKNLFWISKLIQNIYWFLKVYQVSSQGRRIVSNFGGLIIKGPYLIGFSVCFW